MQAWRFVGPEDALQRVELPAPDPGAGEVVVEIRAAGLCHSDLHILDDGWGFAHPLTLGHEGAGVVEAVGRGVTDLVAGQRVAVFGASECGTCPQCLAGQPNICPNRRHVGLDIDGCFADLLLASERAVMPIPDALGFAEAAVCCDAVLTPFHALVTVGRLRPDERIAIFGIGGLGHNAVQIAVDRDARVIAVDPVRAKREAALAAGAVHAVANGADLDQTVDLALDLVGSRQTILAAQQAVRPGGRTVVVGLSSRHAPLASLRLASQETAVLGSYWGTRDEFSSCLDLVTTERVRPLVETQPMSSMLEQIERLRAGRVEGRVILVP